MAASDLRGFPREPGLPRVVACGLTVARAGLAPVRGVSFTAGAGEVVGLTGPDRAAASTCIWLVAGLVKAGFGVLRVCGQTIEASAKLDDPHVGIIPHAVPKVPRQRRSPTPRPVMVADLPSELPDYALRWVKNRLQQLSAAGCATLISLADSTPGLLGCDRVYVIEDGAVVAWGEPDRMRTPSPS